jgi:hypothetical protein
MKMEKTETFITCKLIFNNAKSKEEAGLIISRHTKIFEIANFYFEREIGCNKVTFAVVDVPEVAVKLLFNDKAIKNVDLMTSSGKRPTGGEDCSGGCGCAPTG